VTKEALRSSKTSVLTRAAQRNIPEDSILHSLLRRWKFHERGHGFKSHMLLYLWSLFYIFIRFLAWIIAPRFLAAAVIAAVNGTCRFTEQRVCSGCIHVLIHTHQLKLWHLIRIRRLNSSRVVTRSVDGKWFKKGMVKLRNY
jgi:hypothetical protein